MDRGSLPGNDEIQVALAHLVFEVDRDDFLGVIRHLRGLFGRMDKPQILSRGDCPTASGTGGLNSAGIPTIWSWRS